jgi:hypothetical protein
MPTVAFGIVDCCVPTYADTHQLDHEAEKKLKHCVPGKAEQRVICAETRQEFVN